MATQYEVDPISRIEGHLGVNVTTDGAGGPITEAHAHGNLWRGFENFLIGRDVNDAITVTQRICGVCPIPHATASMFAAEHALGISRGMVTFAMGSTDEPAGVPAKAVLIRNLIYASEFVMSHITHFYHLVALSYVQGPPIPPWTPFYADAQYADALVSLGKGATAAGAPAGATDRGVLPLDDANGYSHDVWSAVIKQYVKALRIRRLTFEAGAMFAGRMPMTSAFVAGGVTNQKSDTKFLAKCDLFRQIFQEIGSFVVREYVPLVLALSALYPTYDNSEYNGGSGFGGGCRNLLAWGAFPGVDTAGTMTIKGGYYVDGVNTDPTAQQFMVNSSSPDHAVGTIAPSGAVQLVKDSLVEYVARSNYVNNADWGYADGAQFAYPGDVLRTEPDRDETAQWTTGKYSWIKAPRWKVGSTYYPMEVGPFSRMAVNGIYPVQGGAIVNASNGLAGIYLNGTELDARCVHPDLANALINATLATAGTTAPGGIVTDSESKDTRYTTGTIAGTILTHIGGLKGGFSVMDRLRARAVEAYVLVAAMIGPFVKTDAATNAWSNVTNNDGSGNGGWIQELYVLGEGASGYQHYAAPTTTGNDGVGVSEAPRGALAHFVTTNGTKIQHYQAVVPTTWNGSPKDGADSGCTPGSDAAGNNAASTKRGPIEQAMIGVPFDRANTTTTVFPVTGGTVTAQSGIEVLRVAQSFDPCLACAIH